MAHEYTSAEIASIASRGLHDPASLTLAEVQAVCGTALTQAPDNALARGFGAHAYYNRNRMMDDAGSAILTGVPRNALADRRRR